MAKLPPLRLRRRHPRRRVRQWVLSAPARRPHTQLLVPYCPNAFGTVVRQLTVLIIPVCVTDSDMADVKSAAVKAEPAGDEAAAMATDQKPLSEEKRKL